MARRTRPATARPGIALLDALLALTMASVGLLALLAGAARVAWLDGRTRAAARLDAAADLARERVTATPCAALAAGADSVHGVRVRWWSEPADGGVAITVRAASSRGDVRPAERRVLRRCPHAP
ncbi:MAG TPA: hypothetical protein VFY16_13565 [Gemmatimonadaceae bacterium]|nr:hypothetical protein [Gemmatimonadaceae bacterium]